MHYTKLAELNYNIINNILPCGAITHRWDERVSNLCFNCNILQNSEHLLFTCNGCNLVKNIWIKISEIIQVEIKWKHIVIGFGMVVPQNDVTESYNFVVSSIAYIIFSIYTNYMENVAQLRTINFNDCVKYRLKYWTNIYKTTYYKKYIRLLEKIIVGL